jgi:hypothetical protein
MEIWKLSCEKGEDDVFWLFTERQLAVRSIKMSYSKLPNAKVEDGGGNTILVSHDTEEGEGGVGLIQTQFYLEKIVDGHVYTDVEHL